MAWFHRVRKEDIGVHRWRHDLAHVGRRRKYRLLGFDTPERGGRAKSEHEWKWAEDASNCLEKTISNGETVRIERKLLASARSEVTAWRDSTSTVGT